MPKNRKLRHSYSPQDAPSSRRSTQQPRDVKTLDAIIENMYSVISGPAGQKRDWRLFRTLYHPDARLVLALKREGKMPIVRLLGVEDYIRRCDRIFENEDFWEIETSRKTLRFGNIVQAWSAYESRRAPNGKPFHRGINSIQLCYDGGRWWIVSVMWNTTRG
jgi:hypothetical protein